MKRPARLCLRLLAIVALPTAAGGCWSTIAEQDTHLLRLDGDVPCPPKEEVPTGGTYGSDRCHPRRLVSVDEGPARRVVVGGTAADTATLCKYLVTFEQDYDVENSFCIGGGRPLLAGRVRIAALVRGA